MPDDFDPRGEERLEEVANVEGLAKEAEEEGTPTSGEAPDDAA